MSNGEIFFLGLVLAAFATFAGVMGYQSFAEWRYRKSAKGRG